MRDAFHDDLDSIGKTLIDMGHRVSRSMELATTALLTADLQLAEQVISDDDYIDTMQHELDAKTLSLLARQQPVAGDLRTLAARGRRVSRGRTKHKIRHRIWPLDAPIHGYFSSQGRRQGAACNVHPWRLVALARARDVFPIGGGSERSRYYSRGRWLRPLP